MSVGPPLLTICRFSESVTTLAFLRAFRTFTTSSLVSFREKKCWLTSTLSSSTQPNVLPSVLRENFLLPAAGQDGVVTCNTKPSPSSFQASMPFECPQGAPHSFVQPSISGSS